LLTWRMIYSGGFATERRGHLRLYPTTSTLYGNVPFPCDSFVATSALPEGAFTITTMVVGRDTTMQWASEPYMELIIHGEVSLLPFEAAIAEDTQERVAVHTRTSYRSPLTLERIAHRSAASLLCLSTNAFTTSHQVNSP